MKPIDQLTDAELIAEVAEKVMGWKSEQLYSHGTTRGYFVPHIGMNHLWCPLESWKDFFMVRDVLYGKYWLFSLNDSGNDETLVRFRKGSAYYFEFSSSRSNPVSQRRAGLQAALAAIEEKERKS